MLSNVGLIDRFLRTILGLAMVYGAWVGFIGLWGWLGIILTITGFLGWCPIYSAIGFKTCSISPKK